ncbi:amidohydrolase family domain-containing protein [Hirsutella rhossiliensis]|uniref:Amidohydrolase family domain-containing protein n=1 Tax=Hirsutella rhossiliensis TaxID=111463 RepID=A0A9P8SJE7_9HYPO|nr:amidohydrolase family domain-containing protein [Hirsutella rhossiliensis]KAH0963635.1 amidohydrolase family domain-containing protein [Hirsutella rhossiliensis]
MPGLIDAKVDVGASPGALSTFAAFGITTVIDSTSTNAESQAMHLAISENPTLPSYFATGSAIGPRGASFLGTFPFRAVQIATTPAEAKIVVAKNLTSTGAWLSGTPLADAYKLALDAGFDIVTAVPVDRALDAEVVRGFAQKSIGVVPTLSYLQKAVHMADNTDYDFAHAMAAVKQLHKAGVRICAGTSANEEDGMAVSFGQSLHEELQLLAEAGLSNIEVIRAATCVPSALFGLRDRGGIEPGCRADLLLVDGNPLENLAISNKIRRVWIAGVEIDIR